MPQKGSFVALPVSLPDLLGLLEMLSMVLPHQSVSIAAESFAKVWATVFTSVLIVLFFCTETIIQPSMSSGTGSPFSLLN